MLAEFQQALADLVASPALCKAARGDATVLRERYRLSERETSRLLAVVNHPGMECNCMLYRANRLAPLAMNLPEVVRALDADLRPALDAFWEQSANTDVHFYAEAYRFCEFLRDEVERGRAFGRDLEAALRVEMAVLEERLELSHTEIYSPMRRR